MPLSFRLFDSIDQVDLGAWEHVRLRRGPSIFMDPRFIASVETSMRDSCRFWYIIIYDQPGGPVACACTSAMTIDLSDLADPRVAQLIRGVPRLFSRLRKLKVMSCGLPGSPGEKSLVLASAKDSLHIIGLFDEIIRSLAAQHGMDLIVFKEFGQDDLEWIDPLLRFGYRRISTPPMHLFTPSFHDFDQYRAALTTRYRQQINRSIRKLQPEKVELTILTETQDILNAYTSDVHSLYRQVVARADLNLETLPLEFFRQLATRLRGEVEFIALYKESRIIAFGWCLHAHSAYHMLYAGFDYELNDQLDLYFNLMYAGLDRALRKQVAKIYVGQTASSFKARLGCQTEPRYVFAKGLGPLMSLLIRYGASLLVAKLPPNAPADIFKKPTP